MAKRNWWSRKEERAEEVTYDDALLQALLGSSGVTRTTALQIPTVAGAIELIANTVASTPIRLYEESDGKTVEVKDDRVRLLNDETGDTLNAHDMWKAIVYDYYLEKGGYAYIRKERNKWLGLHYVEGMRIAIQKNPDPIMKDYDIQVDGKPYKPYDFVKILRNTRDGASGTPITADHGKLLEVAYESLVFESNLVRKGGNKKGFLQSEKGLTTEAMDVLKAAFRNLYSNNTENVVVLNKGIEFKESSNTSVEMQLNENKKSNSEELARIFHVPAAVIAGNATEKDISSLVKLAVMPIFRTIESALNKDFLLEREKGKRYWAFDTKELLKGSTKERFEAHAIAVERGIMTRNEVRFAEDLPAIDGMDVISMSLADVIFDIKSGKYFTPNTKEITDTTGDANSPENVPLLDATKDEATIELEGTVASISLNGAQIQSLLQIVTAVASNQLQYDSAVTLITSAFPFDEATAKHILGNPKVLDVPGKETGKEEEP